MSPLRFPAIYMQRSLIHHLHHHQYTILPPATRIACILRRVVSVESLIQSPNVSYITPKSMMGVRISKRNQRQHYAVCHYADHEGLPYPTNITASRHSSLLRYSSTPFVPTIYNQNRIYQCYNTRHRHNMIYSAFVHFRTGSYCTPIYTSILFGNTCESNRNGRSFCHFNENIL